MTDKQQRMAERDFNSMWDALQEPVRALKQQVADLSRQAARAEVAGAVEVVSSLDSAGKKGRLAYLTTDDQIYYDNGTSWVALGGGAKSQVYLGSSTAIGSSPWAVPYDTLDFETVSIASFSPFAFTVSQAGVYEVTVNAVIPRAPPSTAGLYYEFWSYVNSSPAYLLSGRSKNAPSGTGAVNWYFAGSMLHNLSANDVVTIYVVHNWGTPGSLSGSYVSIKRV